MNSLLMKHRGTATKEEFEKTWENAGPTLKPLADLLQELVNEPRLIRGDDFMCPNHYARMVAQEAKRQAYQDVIAMLPKSCR